MQFNSREEWLQWRHQGVGGSDAPIILGKSDWATPLQLHDIKASPFIKEQESNFATDLGNDAEPKIRSLVELIKGVPFPPSCAEMDDPFRFIKVSFDGRGRFQEKNVCLEIKLMGKEHYDFVKENKRPPEVYDIQVQHQLMFGDDYCLFACYPFSKFKEERTVNVDDLILVECFPRKEFQADIFEALCKFWDGVQNKKPPVPTDKDFVIVTGHADLSKKWKTLNVKYEKIKAQLKEVEDEMALVEDDLKSVAEKSGHSRILCAGVKMVLQSRQGSVDYSKVPELKGVDLDKYRRKGSLFWTFNLLTKEKKK